MSNNSGGPAFPVLDYITPDRMAFSAQGMTLRDYFAAKALIGWRESSGTTYAQDAEAAYAMADAMLAERAK